MSIESIPIQAVQVIDIDDRRPNRAKPKEKREVAALLTMYEMSEAAKRQVTRPWLGVYKMYIGDQWDTNRPRWKASIVENHVFSKIETMIPILTDNRPRIEFLPREPQYLEYADLLQLHADYLWRRIGMDRVVTQVTKNCLWYGKGIYYNYFDDEKGEIVTESVDPQNIYPDPNATSIRDARWLIHVAQMSKSEIIDMWPEAAGKLKPGANIIPDPTAYRAQIRDSAGSERRFQVGYEYPEQAGGALTTVVPWTKSTLDDISSQEDMIQVLQFWIRDPSVNLKQMKDPMTGQPLMQDGEDLMEERLKFPGGRHVILAGDRIIHDAPNPFLHGEFPYVEQDCHIMPGEFWPISAAQNLLNLQQHLNKINSQIADNAALMGNGQWLVSRDSGITADKVTARPGEVIQKRTAGSFAERLQAPSLPPYIAQMADSLRIAMDRISGINDVTEGRKPTGITAGVAIEQLQEAGHTRLRLLVRNLEDSQARIGEQWVSMMQQFYDEPRIVRTRDPETGGFAFKQLGPDEIQGQWEVIVASGSTLPRSREVRQKEAIDLLKLGVFDPQAVLEHIDHPGRDEVIRRLKEREQMQLQLAMQAGADPSQLAQISQGQMGSGLAGGGA